MDRIAQAVEFFNAWETGDVDRVAAWFTDDAAYHVALISAWREYFGVGQMNDLLKATES